MVTALRTPACVIVTRRTYVPFLTACLKRSLAFALPPWILVATLARTAFFLSTRNRSAVIFEQLADEWAATIADPEKLKRFVSFVNAPDTPDPTITFVDERGQIRPTQPGENGELRIVAGPTLKVGAV